MQNQQNKNQSKAVVNRISQLIQILVKQDQLNKLLTNKKQILSNQPKNQENLIKRSCGKLKKAKQSVQEMFKRKILQQNMQIRQFKVSNQKTLQINNRKNQKPIYLRSSQIIKQKENKAYLQKVNQQIQKIKVSKESIDKIARKIDYNKFHENNMIWKNRKDQLLDLKRKELSKEKQTQIKQKIEMNPQSSNILKKNYFYQKELLQRFSQYQKKKQLERLNKLKQIKQTETPFTPKLSQRTILIASRSNYNINTPLVFQRISQSPSIDNIRQKSEYINKTQNKKFNNSGISKSRKLLTEQDNIIFSTSRDIEINRKSKSPKTTRDKSTYNKNNKQTLENRQTQRKVLATTQNYQNKNYDDQKLRKILFGNRKQLIKFVKNIIIKQQANQNQLH